MQRQLKPSTNLGDYPMTMLIKNLRGAPALSDFRVAKLLAQCEQLQLPIHNIYAEFVHFAQLNEALSDSEENVLQQLLTYGPTIEEHQPSGIFLLVTPRPGTISPWSSKSTDIAHNCGLDKITRLERGIAFYITIDDGPVLTTEQESQLNGSALCCPWGLHLAGGGLRTVVHSFTLGSVSPRVFLFIVT